MSDRAAPVQRLDDPRRAGGGGRARRPLPRRGDRRAVALAGQGADRGRTRAAATAPCCARPPSRCAPAPAMRSTSRAAVPDHPPAAGDPARDPVRGRRPDRARQAGRAGGPSGAGQPGRHAGQRAARPLRRDGPARDRRRAAAGHRASARQGHLGRDGGRQDRGGDGRRCRPPSPRATSTAPTWPCAGACPRPPPATIDGRDRPRPARSQAHGGGGARRQARRSPTTALLRAWGTAAALLECRLDTGRTHQIRVHLAASGHPLLGDPVYLRRIPAAARALPAAARQAACSTSRARRCTRRGSASAIRCTGAAARLRDAAAGRHGGADGEP